MTISHINGIALTTLSHINGIAKATLTARNGQTLANLGGVAAPTLTGSPTLLAHWDFDAPSTLSLTGSDINSIVTRDGGSYTLTSSASKPTLVSRGGKNTARFTKASSQFMQVASACGVDPSTGCTVAWIVEMVDSAVSTLFFDIANGASAATANRYYLGQFSGATGWRARKATAAANADAQQGSASTAKYCVVARFTGGTGICTLHVQGGAGIDSTSVAAPSGLSHTTLGAVRASGAEASHFDGWAWAGLIYAGDIGATAAEEIAAWGAANYSTPNP